jgi:aminoglycoside phosphotransferase (APT) family kinase protein
VNSRRLRKLGEGREAEVFEVGPHEVLRVLRNPDDFAKAEREAAALRAAGEAGCAVPRIRELTTFDGRPAIIMQRAQGPDLLTQIGKRPWSVLSIGRVLGAMHAGIHKVRAPDEVPDLKAQLRFRIDEGREIPTSMASFALRQLDEMPDGDRLLHGDFHPGNVLNDSSGALVIDWINATRGDPVADVARTKLLLRVGRPPPGTSRFLLALATFGRRLILGSYLTGYRNSSALDMDSLHKWETIHAAARISEHIEGEAPRLEKMLSRRAASAAVI